jgi:tRNA A37 methylthiotransferase MiaB
LSERCDAGGERNREGSADVSALAALAAPDSWIDWNHPPTKGDRRVTQILLSKGCHNKCAFCQSAWMQRYQFCPDAARIRQTYVSLQSNGHRVDFLSNDAYAVPYIRDLPQVEGRRHESQSLTVRCLRKLGGLGSGAEGQVEAP